MNYVSDNILGGQLKPVHNNIELTKAMKGRRNCYLYTVGTFQVNEQNYYDLKLRNIKLVGLAFAQLKYKPSKEKQQGRKPVNIIIDLCNMTLNINVDTNIKLEQKDKYLNGGMQ